MLHEEGQQEDVQMGVGAREGAVVLLPAMVLTMFLQQLALKAHAKEAHSVHVHSCFAIYDETEWQGSHLCRYTQQVVVGLYLQPRPGMAKQ